MTTHVDRRKFLGYTGAAGAATGALWVAPSVLGSSSAFAATSPGTCPKDVDLAFVPGKATTTPPGWPSGDGNGINLDPALNNGWEFLATGMTNGSDALGVFTSYHAPAPSGGDQFVVERNPGTGNISSDNVTYTHTLGPLSTATTYTFTSDIFSVDSNQYTELLDVEILDAGGTPVATLGRYRTDSSSTANNANYTLLTHNAWNSQSWTFQPSAAGTYQIRFKFFFSTAGTGANTGGNNGVGDDIAVTAPTVTCV